MEPRNPAAGSFAGMLPGTAFYTFVETAACHGVISVPSTTGAVPPLHYD